MCVDFLYVIIHVVTKQLHGVLHTPVYLWSLALDRMLQRWSSLIKDVLSTSFVFIRGRSQRTRYVCRLWNQSNPSGSLQGERNRIDQNSIWRELEFPQLLRADILNTRASLILSAWLRGKLGSDFLLCLSFLDGLYSYHMSEVPFCLSLSCEYPVSLSPSSTRAQSPD